jgi:hypothetical protein
MPMFSGSMILPSSTNTVRPRPCRSQRSSYWNIRGSSKVRAWLCSDLMSGYQHGKLLNVAKLVAEVLIEAGKKDLRKVQAPEGVVHLKP